MGVSVIIIGHAGSGKSLLTRNFSRYLLNQGYSVASVNLDPASPPGYATKADIRDFVKTEEVMQKYSLGVNGALLKSMEIGMKHIDDLCINGEHDFVLYDTPGQLELFVFTEFGERLVKRIEDHCACVFIADSSRIKNSSHYSATISQSATVSVMLGIPALTAFNKSDLREVKDPEYYLRELKNEGVLGEYFEPLLRFVEITSTVYRQIRISAKTGQGFYDLFTAINEVFCACGDLS